MSIISVKNRIMNLAKNGAKEQTVSEASLKKAKMVVENRNLLNSGDCAVFFSALNLMNKYVKQNKGKKGNISYGFKNCVVDGINDILNKNIAGVTFCVDKKEGCTYVNVEGLQFSFHYAPVTAKMMEAKSSGNPHYKQENWQGLRLQPYAEEIFNTFYNEFAEGYTSNKTVSVSSDKTEEFSAENANNPFWGNYGEGQTD